MQHFVGFAANFHNSVSQKAAMFHISRERVVKQDSVKNAGGLF